MAAAAPSTIEGDHTVRAFVHPVIVFAVLLVCTQFLTPATHAQDAGVSKAHDIVGFETDIFPILSEGYLISIWYGFSHIRLRAFIARDRIPQFAVQDGFKDNMVKSYAVMADYFFETGFREFWIGAGVQYWDGTVALDGAAGSGVYTNTMLSVTGGYLLRIWGNLYISPAVGVHFRITGDTEVDVNGNTFTPGVVVPDFFIRLGWHF